MAYTSLKPAGTGTPTWHLPAAHRQVPLPGLYQPSTGNVTCLIVHRLFFEVQLEPLEEHGGSCMQCFGTGPILTGSGSDLSQV